MQLVPGSIVVTSKLHKEPFEASRAESEGQVAYAQVRASSGRIQSTTVTMERSSHQRERRFVFISNVFPNHLEPTRGIFNLRQLQALAERGWSFEVVAPVHWFPLHRSRYGPRASDIRISESVQGIPTAHPRAVYIPLSRGALNAWLYEWSIEASIRRACLSGPAFIWSAFAFPDGVASGRLSRKLRLPHVVSVLGSDVHIGFKNLGRRKAICEELAAARLVFAKSQELGEFIVAAGAPSDRIVVEYNGVERSVFRYRSADAAAASLGIAPGGRRILFVGGLVPVKSVGTLLDAFAALKAAGERQLELVVVGDGYERGALEARAAHRGILSDTRFVGRQNPGEVALWMNCSALLCLPSLAEGVPNVILEALASGCPVVASRVGGIPEVHPGARAGSLVPPGDVGALASALTEVLGAAWDRQALAESMVGRSWAENAEMLEGHFRAAGLTH